MRTVFLTLTTCLFVASTAQAKYSGGSGTAADPYGIATAADLIALGETPEDYDKHFILTADIDLDPNLPLGQVFPQAVIPVFAGVFDGCGHKILRLTIIGGSNLGVFGRLEAGATLKNLGVVDVRIAGSGWSIGGLVGWSDESTISDCHASGEVSGGGFVGGLVGWNEGDIMRCGSSGAVAGTSFVGGMVGWNSGRVTQCFSTAAVTNTGWVVGGLVGQNIGAQALVTQCYSSGAVTGGTSVGGLVGENGGTVTHCYSTSRVVGESGVGGLTGWGLWGYSDMGKVDWSFWDTETSGQSVSAGGFGLPTAELQQAGTFIGWGKDPIWTIDEGKDYPRLAWEQVSGAIITTAFYGGGSGTVEDPYQIWTALELQAVGAEPSTRDKHFKLMTDIDLSAFDGKRGPTFNSIGAGYKTPFKGVFDGNGHRISHVTIRGTNHVGLFGVVPSGAEVRNLGVVDVNIVGSGDSVGGLAGSNHGTVIRCYSSGSVAGGYSVGGLVGHNSRGSVSQCFSTAAVDGTSHVGGLVGANRDSEDSTHGKVTHCYSTGPVRGTSWAIGGLVGSGYDHLNSVVTASFWDAQASGQTKSAGGTGKTTVEMQTATTFLDAGWDFVGETANGREDIWWIDEGKDYPRLWWELTEGEKVNP
jgi:hypothetical protein